MFLSGQFILSVFTELDIFIQFGNRTGILMSNGETVLQPSEGCTDRDLEENGWRDLFSKNWTGSMRLEYVWQVVSQLISDSILL